MKIPKEIENQLAKRGWVMTEGESWRKVRGLEWACAYFKYGKQNKICLITVSATTLSWYIQILYAHPITSMYKYERKFGFNVQL